MSAPDIVFFKVLYQKKKIPKNEADYETAAPHKFGQSCVQSKFNLGDKGKCHTVQGKIHNERGVSKFWSPKGDGILPGDIVWMHAKETGKKLKYNEGHVIEKGAPGFRCRDCKY